MSLVLLAWHRWRIRVWDRRLHAAMKTLRYSPEVGEDRVKQCGAKVKHHVFEATKHLP